MAVTVADFLELIGKKVTVTLRGSQEVTGELLNGFNSVIMIKTDEGTVFYALHDVEAIDEVKAKPVRSKKAKGGK